ncbi:MAG: SDR family NAD(P)-dependent oxidoreductase [Ornithinibacter sp.]
MHIAGAHVLLTGATGTIGAALATHLADADARLSLVARHREPLQGLATETGAISLRADLVDRSDLHALVARAEAANGPVDVLINNAAVESSGHLADLTADEVERTVALNLTAPAELSRRVLPGMLERDHGRIVNISSLAGIATFPGLALYGGTKAGLTHLTSGLRADLRGTGVRTLAVEIGPVASDMMARVGGYAPTAAAFDRLFRARLLTMLDADHVAARVVAAIDADRSHLRMPRRAWTMAAVAHAPRAVVQTVLSGIPARAEGARPRLRAVP